ncbi:MAG: hypothetical protein H3Z50_03965 [archaeon]|nr:hypothetical protein [archaeon]MCP8306581.1 hypothetical protein [archaeon]
MRSESDIKKRLRNKSLINKWLDRLSMQGRGDIFAKSYDQVLLILEDLKK